MSRTKENPYLKLVEEFEDVITEDDLRDYKQDRTSFTMRLLFAWLGFLLMGTITFFGALFKFGMSIFVGVIGIILGVLILHFTIKGPRPLSAMYGEYLMYLEAKKKIKKIPKI